MAKKENSFASGIGFILAAAGSAIGLGNLWAFPYKTAKNGGAAFVFIYVACVILIGFVTMLTEIYIGKRAHANTITSFKEINKNLGWIGAVAIAIPFFITCYYSVLGGWTVKFALNSFSGNAGILPQFSANTGEVVLFTAIFVILALTIIAAGVQGGIEKMSKVLMPALFVILIGVVVYSLCLGEGVKEGLEFYLKPDFSGITFSSVLAAMSQAFYSLSLGMGIMISYGSYAGKEINIVKSTGMICIFDTLVALLAGLAIFPAVAHFDPALLDGSKSIGLIYIILPDVFASMGAVGQIVSFFFFSMVAIAAITSIMSLYEVCTQFVLQKFRLNRKKATVAVGVITFAVAVPIAVSLGRVAINGESGPSVFGLDYLTFLDEITNTVLMPVCALLGCVCVGWIIKPRKAITEMRTGATVVPRWLEKLYPVFVKFITPALILVVEVAGVINEIKDGNIPVVVVAYGLIVVSAVVYFIFLRNSYTGTNKDEE